MSRHAPVQIQTLIYVQSYTLVAENTTFVHWWARFNGCKSSHVLFVMEIIKELHTANSKSCPQGMIKKKNQVAIIMVAIMMQSKLSNFKMFALCHFEAGNPWTHKLQNTHNL